MKNNINIIFLGIFMIAIIGIVLLSGCVEDREGTVTTTSISQDSITTIPAATTSTIPATTTSTIPATTTAPSPEPNLNYCERDSDCGWVSCCSYGYKCMRKDALSCPSDNICLAYIEPVPSEPCVCINNRCSVQAINEVILTTDKTEYERGDTVKIVISAGDKQIYVSYTFGTGVSFYQLRDNEWKKMTTECETNCMMVCENDILEKEICNVLAPPLYHYYEYRGPWEIVWAQKECIYETKPCGDTNYSKGSLRQVSSGRFKVEFCYFDKADVDVSKLPGYASQDKKKCIEKEFTITTDSRVVDPSGVDKNNNKISDYLDAKMEDGSYRRYGNTNQADLIISFDKAPRAEDAQMIKDLGGDVYDMWSSLAYAVHASLPVSKINAYISKNPQVVLIEENSEVELY